MRRVAVEPSKLPLVGGGGGGGVGLYVGRTAWTCVCRYMPVLMQQAKLVWDAGDYAELEKMFERTSDYCSDSETWKLNLAHVLYMRDTKFTEAISFYEPIVHKHYDNVTSSSSTNFISLSDSPLRHLRSPTFVFFSVSRRWRRSYY